MRTASNPDIKAPVIPAAEADGLIKLSELTQDLAMHFYTWNGLRPGDTYQLAFNDLAIGPRISFPDLVPERLVKLTIPLALLETEGTHRVAYRVTSYPGNDVYDSPATLVRIDHTAPGAALLAPLIFPYTQEVLTAHIPGYAGMAVGDTLQSFCNGVPGPVHIVSEDDLGTRLMQIGFSRTFLQGLDSAEIDFTYHVTDRAGNRSRLAPAVRLTI